MTAADRPASQFEVLFRDGPLPMWIYDVATLRFLDVNDTACVVYGWSRTEFLQLTLADVRPREDVPRMQASAWGELPCWTRTGPWTHCTRDGHRLPVEIISHATEYGGRPARFVMVIDLTEPLLAQQALETSHDRLALAIESGRIGLWEWDLRTQQVQVNEQWAAMLGASVEQFGAMTVERIRALCHPDDREMFRSGLDACVRGERDDAEQELRLRHVDGHDVWVLARLRVTARGAGGDAQRLLCTTLDVSERKEAERARAERELAVQAIRVKSEFIARASHELRTPLNAVLGFCQLLQMNPRDPLSAAQQMQVQTIERAGRHLLALVGDLLELSSLEAGRVEMATEPVPVQALVEEVAQLLVAQAQIQQVDVRVQPPDDGAVLFARADPVRLRQALLNLLANGVKYNRPGGEVVLRVAARAQHVRIEVADTGAGMDAAQLAHLFEPFNRLGRNTSAVEGTGIGLAITRQLVEQMDGSVEVQSTVGEGSVFTVQLPRTAG